MKDIKIRISAEAFALIENIKNGYNYDNYSDAIAHLVKAFADDGQDVTLYFAAKKALGEE